MYVYSGELGLLVVGRQLFATAAFHSALAPTYCHELLSSNEKSVKNSRQDREQEKIELFILSTL